MQSRLNDGRDAFTIIEILVVIGIIAVLIAMLLPVIQQARESVNLTQCQNNLRQIGIALIHHHDSHRVLPHNGGWDEKQTIKATDGSFFTPTTVDKSLKKTFHWGVGQPGLSPSAQTGSWCYAILPFLEHQDTFHSQTWSQPVSSYICQSRRNVGAYEVIAEDLYGVYEGGGWKWARTDYGANDYLIGPRPKCYRFLQITDGTSNTLMIGEKAFNPRVQTPNSWYFDEGYFLGGSAGTARSGLNILQDSPSIDFKQNWGSAHKSGANFLFADGAVRNLVFGTPWSMMAPQLVPNDGDILPLGE